MSRFSLILIALLFIMNNLNLNAQIKLGIFADCQYCDCDPSGSRFYRNSRQKLNACIGVFNPEKNLEFIVGLGDLIDRNVESFKDLRPILDRAEHPVYPIAGNHDFEVAKEKLGEVPQALGIDKMYYFIEKEDWHFIFLNGNEITFQSNNPEIVAEAEKMLAKLKASNQPNSYEWNGGMSRKQINWMEKQLQAAEEKNQKVAIFCHYPLLPLEAHTLWNSKEVLEILNKYDNIKMWMNGHNHAGNYVHELGIHFVTLTGMVETENDNAFALVSFSDNCITIQGFGREKNRKLEF